MGRVFEPLGPGRDTKSAFANSGAGEQGHSVSQQGAMNAGVGADAAMAADLDTRSNDRIWADYSPLTDGGSRAHHGSWTNDGFRMHIGGSGNEAGAPWLEMARFKQHQANLAMRVARRLRDQARDAFGHTAARSLRDHHDSEIRAKRDLSRSIAVNERKLSRLRAFCGRDSGDQLHRVTKQFSVRPRRSRF
jgi:hypothetical protein